MLDQSEVPLTNTQLIDFFLDLDYTDYFSVQEVLGKEHNFTLVYHDNALDRIAIGGVTIATKLKK